MLGFTSRRASLCDAAGTDNPDAEIPYLVIVGWKISAELGALASASAP